MRIQFLIIFLIESCFLIAQEDLEFDMVETPNGYEFRVSNNEVCPVSLNAVFRLKNLRIPGGRSQTFLIPPNVKGHLVTELLIKNKRKSTSFSYSLLTALGDVTQTSYDEHFEYYLPYEKSQSFKVSQGYNGALSHQKFNALDFEMPIGTPLTAIRGGIVVKVVEKHSRNCRSSRCLKYNNYIKIYHSDGTFADYTHIKKNGSVVEVGDKIEIGQLIGYSGNTGFTTGPHLHLAVYRRKLKDVVSLKTKFLIGDGRKVELLEEGETYLRDY